MDTGVWAGNPHNYFSAEENGGGIPINPGFSNWVDNQHLRIESFAVYNAGSTYEVRQFFQTPTLVDLIFSAEASVVDYITCVHV